MWGEKCDSWVLTETEGLSVKFESMPCLTREKLHFHSVAQQFFFMLKGSATFYIEDEKIIVETQQGILFEPNQKHLIANETKDSIDFLVISQPTTKNDRTTIEE